MSKLSESYFNIMGHSRRHIKASVAYEILTYPSYVLGMANFGPAGATRLSLNLILWAKIRLRGPKFVINKVACKLGLDRLEIPKLQYWPLTILTTDGNCTL